MSFPECSMICPKGAYQLMITAAEQQNTNKKDITCGDLARWMEVITEKHLSFFGMSREGLKQEGKIWVISWTSIEILRLPKEGEQILLRIWPCKRKGGMYPRKYAFYTVEGEPLACASSLFALMDSKTRTLASPTEKLKDIPVIVEEKEQDLPKMLMPFPEALRGSASRRVCSEEIDKNGHLNNTHYIDWACELAEQVTAGPCSPESVWVQYSRELLEGQDVVLKYEQEEHTFYIRGYAEQEEAFSVIIKMKE